MAFTGLLRVAVCRGTVSPLCSVRHCPITFMRGSSLGRSHVGRENVLSKFVGVQCIRNIKVQPYSTSPSAGHNHSKIWTIERALSAALLALVPAALISPNKLFDSLAAIALVVHSHWGIEALVVDYIRPVLFGNTIPKVALGGVYALSIITLAGLFQLIYNDIGFANTVKKIWSL